MYIPVLLGNFPEFIGEPLAVYCVLHTIKGFYFWTPLIFVWVWRTENLYTFMVLSILKISLPTIKDENKAVQYLLIGNKEGI